MYSCNRHSVNWNCTKMGKLIVVQENLCTGCFGLILIRISLIGNKIQFKMELPDVQLMIADICKKIYEIWKEKTKAQLNMFIKRIYGTKTRSYLKKSNAFTFLSAAGTTLYFPSSSLKALKSWKALTFSVALLNKFGLLWHFMIWYAITILPYDACDTVIKSQWLKVVRW